MKKLHDLIMKNKNGGYDFAGVEVSEYGQEHNKIDYGTLAKVVGAHILNNDIINFEVDYWETTSGSMYEIETTYYDEDYNEIDEDEAEELKKQGKEVIEEENEGDYKEFFQYYIISPSGADFLERFTEETVFYNNRLDIYLWAIDHLGTGWDYVLTPIEIEYEI